MKCLSFTVVLSFIAAGLAVPHNIKPGRGFRLSNTDAIDIIPGSFIAVYNNNATSEAVALHQQKLTASLSKRDLCTLQMFEMSGWKAFAIQAEDGVMTKVANSPEVAYIEADTIVHTAVLKERALLEQPGTPAGLNRISHKAVGAKTYVFDETAGAGISVFIIDTGILPTHSEFAGRASMGANLVTGSANVDENGHGTHVAGTIGGENFGVAKSVNLIGVKVLDAQGAGKNSQVLAGINWVTNEVAASNLAGKAVINMSLGGGRSNAINAAVAAATRAGITMVVAAGNENANAQDSSPASAPSAITVGAISPLNDVRASFSNFGASLDIFAPGVNVLSSSIGSNTATEVLSGTSMASPHIAGLCAYIMALENLTTVDSITTRLKTLAAEGGGVVSRAGTGSPTLIAYNGSGV